MKHQIARLLTSLAATAFVFTCATMTVTFSPSTARAHGPVHDAMKDDIGPAFKVIATDMKAGVITSKTQLAGKTLLNAFTALQAVVPTTVPDQGGGHPATAQEIADFKKMMSDMLDLVKVLVPQLDASDVAGAQKTVQQIGALRGQAHDQFKAD